MNIIHIITTLDRGGAENQLVQNLLFQSKKGLNVTVLFLKGNGYWSDCLRQKKIKVYGPFFYKSYYLNPISIISFLKRIFKSNGIIHCHMPPSLCIVSFLSIFLINRKVIYTSHNDEPFFPLIFLDSIFSKFILRKPDKIISITTSVKNYLIKKYNVKRKKINIVEYSFDPDVYKNKNFKKDEFTFYKSNKIYIGTVARLVKQKRIDILLKAFREINLRDNDIYLVILGRGEKRNELINQSKKLNIYKNIIWIDYSENVIEHMKNWSVFCLTSEYEGFGLVLLEAIYAKLPIVAMNVSSIKNIVGKCGKIVDFEDFHNFSKEVLDVISKREKYLNQDYINQFSPEKNFKKHLKIYNSL